MFNLPRRHTGTYAHYHPADTGMPGYRYVDTASRRHTATLRHRLALEKCRSPLGVLSCSVHSSSVISSTVRCARAACRAAARAAARSERRIAQCTRPSRVHVPQACVSLKGACPSRAREAARCASHLLEARLRAGKLVARREGELEGAPECTCARVCARVDGRRRRGRSHRSVGGRAGCGSAGELRNLKKCACELDLWR